MAAAELTALKHQLAAARSEISKLHRAQNELTRRVQRPRCGSRRGAGSGISLADASPDAQVASSMLAAMKPIGCIESCFPHKNGTPRQPRLAPGAPSAAAAHAERRKRRAQPRRPRAVLARVAHLPLPQEWRRGRRQGAKVRPPRLGGQPVGMFACRTPHRPCAIGLSLVTLLGVEDDSLVLAGADLVDGTPILDVKPFVPYSDTPPLEQVRAPLWVAPESGTQLRVRFSRRGATAARRAVAPAATGPLARCASLAAAPPRRRRRSPTCCATTRARCTASRIAPTIPTACAWTASTRRAASRATRWRSRR